MDERSAPEIESRHGRLPWLRPEELSDEQRELYEAIVSGPRVTRGSRSAVCDSEGRLRGPFNALLFMPGTGMALQELGVQLRFDSTLTDRQREIATLLTAIHNRSEGEIKTHRRLAGEIGLSADALFALEQGHSLEMFSKDEEVTVRLTRSLLIEGDISDALHFEATELLGTEAVCELVVLVGYYSLLAMHLRVWRVPTT
jgi:4-carboxymuconolactone decarboxylase